VNEEALAHWGLLRQKTIQGYTQNPDLVKSIFFQYSPYCHV